jgi:predicted RNase H-like nuclease (RuvC/YqgF family)
VRPPSREELEAKVSETQQRLQELKRVQDELERERATLEEARRRRSEFQVGREEMLEHLTRGIGLLEEAEFGARRDAEQMAKTLGELRDSLIKVQSLNDQSWTQENYSVELTRGLTTIENARMEWNAAQLKWTVLTRKEGLGSEGPVDAKSVAASGIAGMTGLQLAKLGLAVSWPLAVIALAAVVALILILIYH